MNYTISISICDQRLNVGQILSVNGTVDIIRCEFTFDESWEAFPARQAIFGNTGATTATYVAAIADDSCVVPWEALKKPGKIRMAIVGTNTDGQVQRTETRTVVVQTKTLQGGVNSIEPTPDQYAQFVEEVRDMIGEASVFSVNGQTGDVTLTASDVGALPDTVTVPTKTSDLTNDSGFLTSIPSQYVTETEMATAIAGKANTADLAAVATSGSYNDLSNKPTIPTLPNNIVNTVNGQSGNVTITVPTVPTNVSAFANDAGYLTAVPSQYVTETELATAISGKANAADLATVATSGSYNDLTNKPTIPTVPANIVTTFNGQSGAVTYTAPVSSVNGQTGAVVIGNATTSAAGLMSAADKATLDAVAADYQSALTALGV